MKELEQTTICGDTKASSLLVGYTRKLQLLESVANKKGKEDLRNDTFPGLTRKAEDCWRLRRK